MRSILHAIAFMLAAGPAGAQTHTMDGFVRDFLERHGIPGASIAVVRDGRIVEAAGYGTANLELGVPATDRTVYEIETRLEELEQDEALWLRFGRRR